MHQHLDIIKNKQSDLKIQIEPNEKSKISHLPRRRLLRLTMLNVEVASFGKAIDEALANLKEAVELYFKK